MERETPYSTLVTINQVNMLILKVKHLLDTSTDENCFLNIPELSDIDKRASEIANYAISENDIDIIDKITPSTPLYTMALCRKMESDTRASVLRYCRVIGNLKQWVQHNRTLKNDAKRERQIRALQDTESKTKNKNGAGRPRSTDIPFINYFKLNISEQNKIEIIREIETLMSAHTSPTDKIIVLGCAVNLEIISKPSFPSVVNTFGIKVGHNTYYRALGIAKAKGKYDDRVEIATNDLLKIMEKWNK